VPRSTWNDADSSGAAFSGDEHVDDVHGDSAQHDPPPGRSADSASEPHAGSPAPEDAHDARSTDDSHPDTSGISSGSDSEGRHDDHAEARDGSGAPDEGDGSDAAVPGGHAPGDADLLPVPGDLVPVPGARFAQIPLAGVVPNPRQPRQTFAEDDLRELEQSIREVGVLQPVVVRPLPAVDGQDRYELVMGERRWRACLRADLATVPAIVRDTADAELLRDALLENLHRADLNPIEEAAAYQQLLEDFGCTHDELATRLGRSRPQITNTLRLLRLPATVQRHVVAGTLTAGHARALLGAADGEVMCALADRVVAEGLSVRATEEAVAAGAAGVSAAPRQRPGAGAGRPEGLDRLATRLSDRLETRVSIALGRSKGRLTVEFASMEDLERIIADLAPTEAAALRGESVA
jgi:ParB family transcriptional regulator, chromosome partitioning protein